MTDTLSVMESILNGQTSIAEKKDEYEEVEMTIDQTVTSSLYEAIMNMDWNEAMQILTENPSEASTWIERRDANTGYVARRFLPLHSVSARQPPEVLVSALLKAYPGGAGCPDDEGMYPLHYACGNQASAEVIRLLLMIYPQASSILDPQGMLPIHYVAEWGPSDMSVLDMLLYSNRDVKDVRDSEGNTPLDLAIMGEYPEREEVIKALATLSANSSPTSAEANAKQSAGGGRAFQFPEEESQQEADDSTAGHLRVDAPMENVVEDEIDSEPISYNNNDNNNNIEPVAESVRVGTPTRTIQQEQPESKPSPAATTTTTSTNSSQSNSDRPRDAAVKKTDIPTRGRSPERSLMPADSGDSFDLNGPFSMDNATEVIVKLQSKIKKMKSSRAETETELLRLHKDRTDIESKLDKALEENGRLEGEVKSKEALLRFVETNMGSADDEDDAVSSASSVVISDLRSALTKAQEAKRAADAKTIDRENDVKLQIKEKTAIQTSLDKVTSERDKLVDELKEVEQHVSLVREEVEEKEKELEKKSNYLRFVETKVEEGDERTAGLQVEVDTLKSEMKALSEDRDEIKSQLESLRKTLDEEKAGSSAVQAERDGVRGELEMVRKDVEAVKEACGNAQQEILLKEDLVKSMETTLSKKESELSKKTDELYTVQNVVENLKSAHDELEGELITVRCDRDEYESKLKQSDNKINELKLTIRDLNQKLSASRRENELIERDVSTLRREKQFLQEEVKKTKDSNVQLQTEKVGLIQEIETRDEALVEMDQKITEKDSTLQTLDEQVTTLQSSLDEVSKKYEERKAEAESLSDKFAEATTTIETLSAECDTVVNSNVSLKNTLEDSTKMNSRLLTELDSLKKELGETSECHAMVKTELSAERERVSTLSEEVAARDVHIAATEGKLKVTMDELEDNRAKSEMMEVALEKATGAQADLNAHVQMVKEECANAASEIEKLEMERLVHKGTISDLNEKLSTTEREMGAVLEERNKLRVDNGRQTELLEALSAEVTSAKEKIQTLESEVESKQSLFMFVEAKVEETNREMSVLKEEKAKVEAALYDKTKALEQRIEQVEALTEYINTLTQSAEELTRKQHEIQDVVGKRDALIKKTSVSRQKGLQNLMQAEVAIVLTTCDDGVDLVESTLRSQREELQAAVKVAKEALLEITEGISDDVAALQ